MGIDKRNVDSGHSKALRHTAKRQHSVSPLPRGKKPKTPLPTLMPGQPSPKPPSDGDSVEALQRCYRVGTACQRCRVRKTKCDTQVPCQRCQDDGLICTGGSNMRAHSAHGPMIQVQILEHTRSVLVALVNKLYVMGRDKISWTYGRVIENGRGDPLIHDMAEKILGVSSRNLELTNTQSTNTLIGDDGTGLKAESPPQLRSDEAATAAGVDHASSSSRDVACQTTGSTEALTGHSQCSQDHQASIEGPQPASALSVLRRVALQQRQQQQLLAKRIAMQRRYGAQFLRHNSVLPSKLDFLSAGLLESNLGTVMPHQLSRAESGVMKGIGDPMLADVWDLGLAD